MQIQECGPHRASNRNARKDLDRHTVVDSTEQLNRLFSRDDFMIPEMRRGIGSGSP